MKFKFYATLSSKFQNSFIRTSAPQEQWKEGKNWWRLLSSVQPSFLPWKELMIRCGFTGFTIFKMAIFENTLDNSIILNKLVLSWADYGTNCSCRCVKWDKDNQMLINLINYSLKNCLTEDNSWRQVVQICYKNSIN